MKQSATPANPIRHCAICGNRMIKTNREICDNCYYTHAGNNGETAVGADRVNFHREHLLNR